MDHMLQGFQNRLLEVCTAVAVRSLVHPDWILEIEAIAYLE